MMYAIPFIVITKKYAALSQAVWEFWEEFWVERVKSEVVVFEMAF